MDPLGDFLHHFLLNYSRLKPALAEFKGERQSLGWGERRSCCRERRHLTVTSSTLTLGVAKNWEKLFLGDRLEYEGCEGLKTGK